MIRVLLYLAAIIVPQLIIENAAVAVPISVASGLVVWELLVEPVFPRQRRSEKTRRPFYLPRHEKVRYCKNRIWP